MGKARLKLHSMMKRLVVMVGLIPYVPARQDAAQAAMQPLHLSYGKLEAHGDASAVGLP